MKPTNLNATLDARAAELARSGNAIGWRAARILDVCCGGRMFWFDKGNEQAIFVDRRVAQYTLKDMSVNGGQRGLSVRPNIQADFAALPFPSNYFQMVVFDPPHFDKLGKNSWLRAKYGALEGNWRAMLRGGFAECFRVLAPSGTLIFKWSSVQIPLSKILALTPCPPLFGHHSGKHAKTHWVAFMKQKDIGEIYQHELGFS